MSRVMLICSHCGAKAISSQKFVGKPHLGCRENGEWILDTSFSKPETAQPLDIADEEEGKPEQKSEKRPLPRVPLTKEEAGCIASVVGSVVELGLLKNAPIDIEKNIHNGLAKLIAYAKEKYPV